jgi:CSLREA domain-containing protein
VLQLEILEDRLAPATLTVNTLADEATADTTLSLREAVGVVNSGSTGGLSSAERAQVSGTLGSPSAATTPSSSTPASPAGPSR